MEGFLEYFTTHSVRRVGGEAQGGALFADVNGHCPNLKKN